MLNGTVALKLLWIAFSGVLILLWVTTIFGQADTPRTLLGTAGMLMGVLLFSVNAAALLEQLFQADK